MFERSLDEEAFVLHENMRQLVVDTVKLVFFF